MFDRIKKACQALWLNKKTSHAHFLFRLDPLEPGTPVPRPKPKTMPESVVQRDPNTFSDVRWMAGVVPEVTLDIPMPSGPAVPKAELLVHASTPLMCTSCKTSDAQTYYLKRRRGLYDLLCFRNGKGCWEHSTKTGCSYIESETGAQCTRLAEYEVVSLDGRSSRVTCLPCLPFMIDAGTPGNQVYPLD